MAIVTFHLYRTCRATQRRLKVEIVVEIHGAGVTPGSESGEFGVATVESGNVLLIANHAILGIQVSMALSAAVVCDG
jgi:hypothetical protein